ncbi:Hypothetical_protein [Hexamita inflata]|uniref:Hypothetical_protein n=1 Tax=Hexamita inflata TaxID=28002 RepID=A0AA86P9Q1_9EUKA|nr:Hypothetical protein HINF_LOCUS1945 [Hexamita inflata]CAI9934672.1 Hypothetical protein HINF_LOCUS22317 [Hexamita inflata]
MQTASNTYIQNTITPVLGYYAACSLKIENFLNLWFQMNWSEQLKNIIFINDIAKNYISIQNQVVCLLSSLACSPEYDSWDHVAIHRDIYLCVGQVADDFDDDFLFSFYFEFFDFFVYFFDCVSFDYVLSVCFDSESVGDYFPDCLLRFLCFDCSDQVYLNFAQVAAAWFLFFFDAESEFPDCVISPFVLVLQVEVESGEVYNREWRLLETGACNRVIQELEVLIEVFCARFEVLEEVKLRFLLVLAHLNLLQNDAWNDQSFAGNGFN